MQIRKIVPIVRLGGLASLAQLKIKQKCSNFVPDVKQTIWNWLSGMIVLLRHVKL